MVISDVHLGTYGCHAKELLQYLKSIDVKHLVLNGDIIDIWQFNKRYWPKSHMKVFKHIISLLGDGVRVSYITGNHDELLRKFSGFEMGGLEIVNKLKLSLPSGDAWIFHGDVFDVSMRHSKWLAKLGGIGYDMLILLNRSVNNGLEYFGRPRISLSKRIKNKVKSAVSYMSHFEQLVADLASQSGFSYAVCGHIHQPCIKRIDGEAGEVIYLNSGDWVENLTSLEYHAGEWNLYFHEELLDRVEEIEQEVEQELNDALSIVHLMQEFKIPMR